MLLLQERRREERGRTGGEMSKQGDKWLVGQASEGWEETAWWEWNVGDSSGRGRRWNDELKQAGDCSWSAKPHLTSCKECYQLRGEGSVADRAGISRTNGLTAHWPQVRNMWALRVISNLQGSRNSRFNSVLQSKQSTVCTPSVIENKSDLCHLYHYTAEICRKYFQKNLKNN